MYCLCALNGLPDNRFLARLAAPYIATKKKTKLMSDDYKFDTLSLHAGHVPDDRYGSRAVPIHHTTSYVFKDTRHAAALYNMEVGGHLY